MPDNNFKTLVDLLIRAEEQGAPRHELVVDVCDTPRLLVQLGLQPLRVVVKAKTIGKMFFDHGLARSQIERIPGLLATPKEVFTSETQPDSVVVLTFELHLGAPVIIPIARGRQIGRGRLVNELTSMYAKTGPDPTARWRRNGLLLWEQGL